MKSLINHRYIKIILFITVLVSITFVLKYNFDLYSTVYNSSSKYVNATEGFSTNVTDTNGKKLNTTDKYMIYSVPHKKVLQARSDKSVKSASINLSKPNIKINDDMIFKIIDNQDGSQGIWNIGKKGVLGMDDAKSKTYIKPMKYSSSLPTEMTQERFNIVNHGKNNTVAVKSTFYKERYYYLDNKGNTRIGKGLGNWEKMLFVNYSVIEKKRLEIEDEEDRRRISRNMQIAKDDQNTIYDSQYDINTLQLKLDNNVDNIKPGTYSKKIKTLQSEIDKLITK